MGHDLTTEREQREVPRTLAEPAPKTALGIVPTGWTSASLLSFLVAALVAHVMNLVLRRR